MKTFIFRNLLDFADSLKRFAISVPGWFCGLNAVKITALITLNCFLLTGVYGQAVAALTEDIRATQQFKQIFEGFSIPYSYGKITSSKFNGSDAVVVNIQDLHSHPQVQKNISNIIKLFDKEFGVKNVYLEGAYGQVDTSWLAGISNKDQREKIMDALVREGRLTGAEYYSVESGRTDVIKGLEDKDEYLANLKRFGDILNSQEEISLILSSIGQDLDALKKTYFNKRQLDIEELSKKYQSGALEAKKYFALMYKHSDRLGIDVDRYENIRLYSRLLQLGRRIDHAAASKELQLFVMKMKEVLPYSYYKMVVDSTNNFSEMDRLYTSIIMLAKEGKIDLDLNFAELSKFLQYYELGKKINALEMIKEEAKFVDEINAGFADNNTEREIIFLTSFHKYLKDYLSSKITSDDYRYYRDNVSEFKRLWIKYVDNQKPGLLAGYEKTADAFYGVNSDRNGYFVKNIDAVKTAGKLEDAQYADVDETAKIIKSMKDAKNISIAVTGGFHTQGVAELLGKQGISYIVITPNVSGGVELAEEKYYQIAKEQSKILFNALATLVPSLLSDPEKFSLVLGALTEGVINSKSANIANAVEDVLNAFIRAQKTKMEIAADSVEVNGEKAEDLILTLKKNNGEILSRYKYNGKDKFDLIGSGAASQDGAQASKKSVLNSILVGTFFGALAFTIAFFASPLLPVWAVALLALYPAGQFLTNITVAGAGTFLQSNRADLEQKLNILGNTETGEDKDKQTNEFIEKIKEAVPALKDHEIDFSTERGTVAKVSKDRTKVTINPALFYGANGTVRNKFLFEIVMRHELRHINYPGIINANEIIVSFREFADVVAIAVRNIGAAMRAAKAEEKKAEEDAMRAAQEEESVKAKEQQAEAAQQAEPEAAAKKDAATAEPKAEQAEAEKPEQAEPEAAAGKAGVTEEGIFASIGNWFFEKFISIRIMIGSVSDKFFGKSFDQMNREIGGSSKESRKEMLAGQLKWLNEELFKGEKVTITDRSGSLVEMSKGEAFLANFKDRAFSLYGEGDDFDGWKWDKTEVQFILAVCILQGKIARLGTGAGKSDAYTLSAEMRLANADPELLRSLYLTNTAFLANRDIERTLNDIHGIDDKGKLKAADGNNGRHAQNMRALLQRTTDKKGEAKDKKELKEAGYITDIDDIQFGFLGDQGDAANVLYVWENGKVAAKKGDAAVRQNIYKNALVVAGASPAAFSWDRQNDITSGQDSISMHKWSLVMDEGHRTLVQNATESFAVTMGERDDAQLSATLQSFANGLSFDDSRITPNKNAQKVEADDGHKKALIGELEAMEDKFVERYIAEVVKSRQGKALNAKESEILKKKASDFFQAEKNNKNRFYDRYIKNALMALYVYDFGKDYTFEIAAEGQDGKHQLHIRLIDKTSTETKSVTMSNEAHLALEYVVAKRMKADRSVEKKAYEEALVKAKTDFSLWIDESIAKTREGYDDKSDDGKKAVDAETERLKSLKFEYDGIHYSLSSKSNTSMTIRVLLDKDEKDGKIRGIIRDYAAFTGTISDRAAKVLYKKDVVDLNVLLDEDGGAVSVHAGTFVSDTKSETDSRLLNVLDAFGTDIATIINAGTPAEAARQAELLISKGKKDKNLVFVVPENVSTASLNSEQMRMWLDSLIAGIQAQSQYGKDKKGKDITVKAFGEKLTLEQLTNMRQALDDNTTPEGLNAKQAVIFNALKNGTAQIKDFFESMEDLFSYLTAIPAMNIVGTNLIAVGLDPRPRGAVNNLAAINTSFSKNNITWEQFKARVGRGGSFGLFVDLLCIEDIPQEDMTEELIKIIKETNSQTFNGLSDHEAQTRYEELAGQAYGEKSENLSPSFENAVKQILMMDGNIENALKRNADGTVRGKAASIVNAVKTIKDDYESNELSQAAQVQSYDEKFAREMRAFFEARNRYRLDPGLSDEDKRKPENMFKAYMFEKMGEAWSKFATALSDENADLGNLFSNESKQMFFQSAEIEQDVEKVALLAKMSEELAYREQKRLIQEYSEIVRKAVADNMIKNNPQVSQKEIDEISGRIARSIVSNTEKEVEANRKKTSAWHHKLFGNIAKYLPAVVKMSLMALPYIIGAVAAAKWIAGGLFIASVGWPYLLLAMGLSLLAMLVLYFKPFVSKVNHELQTTGENAALGIYAAVGDKSYAKQAWKTSLANKLPFQMVQYGASAIFVFIIAGLLLESFAMLIAAGIIVALALGSILAMKIAYKDIFKTSYLKDVKEPTDKQKSQMNVVKTTFGIVLLAIGAYTVFLSLGAVAAVVVLAGGLFALWTAVNLARSKLGDHSSTSTSTILKFGGITLGALGLLIAGIIPAIGIFGTTAVLGFFTSILGVFMPLMIILSLYGGFMYAVKSANIGNLDKSARIGKYFKALSPLVAFSGSLIMGAFTSGFVTALMNFIALNPYTIIPAFVIAVIIIALANNSKTRPWAKFILQLVGMAMPLTSVLGNSQQTVQQQYQQQAQDRINNVSARQDYEYVDFDPADENSMGRFVEVSLIAQYEQTPGEGTKIKYGLEDKQLLDDSKKQISQGDYSVQVYYDEAMAEYDDIDKIKSSRKDSKHSVYLGVWEALDNISRSPHSINIKNTALQNEIARIEEAVSQGGATDKEKADLPKMKEQLKANIKLQEKVNEKIVDAESMLEQMSSGTAFAPKNKISASQVYEINAAIKAAADMFGYKPGSVQYDRFIEKIVSKTSGQPARQSDDPNLSSIQMADLVLAINAVAADPMTTYAQYSLSANNLSAALNADGDKVILQTSKGNFVSVSNVNGQLLVFDAAANKSENMSIDDLIAKYELKDVETLTMMKYLPVVETPVQTPAAGGPPADMTVGQDDYLQSQTGVLSIVSEEEERDRQLRRQTTSQDRAEPTPFIATLIEEAKQRDEDVAKFFEFFPSADQAIAFLEMWARQNNTLLADGMQGVDKFVNYYYKAREGILYANSVYNLTTLDYSARSKFIEAVPVATLISLANEIVMVADEVNGNTARVKIDNSRRLRLTDASGNFKVDHPVNHYFFPIDKMSEDKAESGLRGILKMYNNEPDRAFDHIVFDFLYRDKKLALYGNYVMSDALRSKILSDGSLLEKAVPQVNAQGKTTDYKMDAWEKAVAEEYGPDIVKDALNQAKINRISNDAWITTYKLLLELPSTFFNITQNTDLVFSGGMSGTFGSGSGPNFSSRMNVPVVSQLTPQSSQKSNWRNWFADKFGVGTKFSNTWTMFNTSATDGEIAALEQAHANISKGRTQSYNDQEIENDILANAGVHADTVQADINSAALRAGSNAPLPKWVNDGLYKAHTDSSPANWAQSYINDIKVGILEAKLDAAKKIKDNNRTYRYYKEIADLVDGINTADLKINKSKSESIISDARKFLEKAGSAELANLKTSIKDLPKAVAVKLSGVESGWFFGAGLSIDDKILTGLLIENDYNIDAVFQKLLSEKVFVEPSITPEGKVAGWSWADRTTGAKLADGIKVEDGVIFYDRWNKPKDASEKYLTYDRVMDIIKNYPEFESFGEVTITHEQDFQMRMDFVFSNESNTDAKFAALINAYRTIAYKGEMSKLTGVEGKNGLASWMFRFGQIAGKANNSTPSIIQQIKN
ncbi:MAG: hypothetical protein LBL00_05295, partial [Endomicrobium sp.]|nr:hypothetical protein [Endomicrobium sp.]